MPRGKVKWYDSNLGYGFIAVPGNPDGIYVHRRALGPAWSCLAPGEDVEFEVFTGGKGKPEAATVRSLLGSDSRLEGIICGYSSKKGIGRIRREDHQGEHAPLKASENEQCDGLFFHHSDILSDTSRTMRNGERVTYEPGHDERGNSRALRIKRLDPRFPLYRFASMGSDREWLEKLVGLAEKERWDFHRPKAGQPRHRKILRNYIIYVFARLDEEQDADLSSNKIAFSDDGQWSCFNTGLVDPDQEETFALFRRSTQPQASGCLWQLFGFFINSDNRLLERIKRRPELADFYEDSADLVFSRGAEIVPDQSHLFDEDRLRRFPEPFRSNRDMAMGAVWRGLQLATARLKRNYKTAIPNYYNGTVELLLPLCLFNSRRADLALALTKVDGHTYRAETVHGLEDAYKMARLLTRPDTDWLDPFDPNVEPEGASGPVETAPARHDESDDSEMGG